MTSGDKSQARHASVDEAMNRVLAAERDARLAVAECRAEAARIVAEAETRARALAGRSEARIKAAHRIADAAIARALAELAEVPSDPGLDVGSEGAPRSIPDDSTLIPEPLAQAVEVLAGEILGGAA
jgi:hypothetical protein